MVAHLMASLIPKLREYFAEFLQHRCFKRLSMLYLSTCVGLRYGLTLRAISWKSFTAQIIRYNLNNLQPSSLLSWSRNINLVPIDYGFRPHLRGRLTLRWLPLRRNPWISGGETFNLSSCYLCQHSHF